MTVRRLKKAALTCLASANTRWSIFAFMLMWFENVMYDCVLYISISVAHLVVSHVSSHLTCGLEDLRREMDWQ